MKTSLTLSLVILVLAAVLGLRDRQRLAEIRKSYEKIAAEAASLGLPADFAKSDPATLPFTHGDRGDHSAEANRAVNGLLAFIDEMNGWDLAAKNHELTEEQQQRYLEMTDRLGDFDAAQLKRLIAALDGRTDLVPQIHDAYTSYAMLLLGTREPQTTLGMILERPDSLLSRQQIIATAIASWAGTDPLAALDWMQTHGEAHPEFLEESLKNAFLGSVAAKDPALAFQLLDQLKFPNPATAASAIIHSATTPEERTAALAALRSHLTAMEDDQAKLDLFRSAFKTLTENVSAEGFEAATEWLAGARLTPEELDRFTESLGPEINSSDTGKWMDWLGQPTPGQTPNTKALHSIMDGWADRDYPAATAWLQATPAGPAKISATFSYATTIARYQPEAAVQWALTLPAGPNRDSALKIIHARWPKQDPASAAAAAAFAAEHGIK